MDDIHAVSVGHIRNALSQYLSERVVSAILQELEPVVVSIKDESGEIFVEITNTFRDIHSALVRISSKLLRASPKVEIEEGQEELITRLNSLFELLKVPKADKEALEKLAGRVDSQKRLLQLLSANDLALKILKRELGAVRQLKDDYHESVEDKARELISNSMKGLEEDLLLAMLQKLYNIGLLNISQHPTSLSELKPSDALALMEVFELITI